MLTVKVATKIAGVYPVTQAFRSPRKEGMYTTLLMSTGLTFGTISALFGLSHEIVDQAQYSALVAAVVASAVVPTLIANAWFMPRHLLRVEEAVSAVPPAAQSEVGVTDVPKNPGRL
jgi:Kef-type K+ transport system membrane component KefB